MQKNTANNSKGGHSESIETSQFRFLLEKLTEEYVSKYKEIQAEEQDVVPVVVFNKKLSPLETVVKFLKENKRMSLTKISEKLKRSAKTVWQAYSNSKKKLLSEFEEDYSKHKVPIKKLGNRRYSILEIIVSYLKEHYGLNYNQIAGLLKRDQRTVWTVYNRAKKK